MLKSKYDCIYTGHSDNKLWEEIRQITIELKLHHFYLPYQGRDGNWHFKVGGTIEQTNDFSRLWAALEDNNEIERKITFFDKFKQFLNISN